MGGPLHDGGVHAVLHGQHGTSSAAKLALQSLKKCPAQALQDSGKHMFVQHSGNYILVPMKASTALPLQQPQQFWLFSAWLYVY